MKTQFAAERWMDETEAKISMSHSFNLHAADSWMDRGVSEKCLDRNRCGRSCKSMQQIKWNHVASDSRR